MTDTEEFRVALADALALPGEVRPRPGVGHALRDGARRRRRVTLVAGAAAVPCLILVAVLLAGGEPDGQRATTPAGGGTPSPSEPSIAPGPRTLSAPIEIRPVVREFLLCPDDESGTVPAAEGDNCYRLGTAGVTLNRVRNLQIGPRPGPNGLLDDATSLLITMTSRDADAFASFTGESVGEQIAFVVDGQVWVAPQVATPIRGGVTEILLDRAPANELIAALTG